MQAPRPSVMRDYPPPAHARYMFEVAAEAAERIMGMPVSPYIDIGTDDNAFLLTLTMWHPLWERLDAPRLTTIEIDGRNPMRHLIAAIIEHTREAARLRDWAVALATLGLDPYDPPAWTVRAPRAMGALLPPDAARSMTEWRNGLVSADRLMCMEFGAKSYQAMRFMAIGGILEWQSDGYDRGLVCHLGTTAYRTDRVSDEMAEAIVAGQDPRSIPGLSDLDETTAAMVRVRGFLQEGIADSTMFDLDMGEYVPLAPPPKGIVLRGPLATSRRSLRLKNSFNHYHREETEDESAWEEAEKLVEQVVREYYEDTATRMENTTRELIAENIAMTVSLGVITTGHSELYDVDVDGEWPGKTVITLRTPDGSDESSYRMDVRDGRLAITTGDLTLELDETSMARIDGETHPEQNDPVLLLKNAFGLFSGWEETRACLVSQDGDMVTASIGLKNEDESGMVTEIMEVIEAELAIAGEGRSWEVDIMLPFAGALPSVSARTIDKGPPREAHLTEEDTQVLRDNLPPAYEARFPFVTRSKNRTITASIGAARRKALVDATRKEMVVQAGRRMLRIRRLGIHPGTMFHISDRAFARE